MSAGRRRADSLILSHFPSQHASWRSRSLSRETCPLQRAFCLPPTYVFPTKLFSILSARYRNFLELPLLVVYKVKPERDGWSFEKFAIKISFPEVQSNQLQAFFCLLIVQRPWTYIKIFIPTRSRRPVFPSLGNPAISRFLCASSHVIVAGPMLWIPPSPWGFLLKEPEFNHELLHFLKPPYILDEPVTPPGGRHSDLY